MGRESSAWGSSRVNREIPPRGLCCLFCSALRPKTVLSQACRAQHRLGEGDECDVQGRRWWDLMEDETGQEEIPPEAATAGWQEGAEAKRKGEREERKEVRREGDSQSP